MNIDIIKINIPKYPFFNGQEAFISNYQMVDASQKQMSYSLWANKRGKSREPQKTTSFMELDKFLHVKQYSSII